MAIKKIKPTKDLDYYLNLPWTYTIKQEVEENNKKMYVIRVNELPGVATDAPTLHEAAHCIKEALTLFFQMSLDAGDEIPEPPLAKNFAGNIAYRTTPERHSIIAREARKRNMSLSQILDSCVDQIVTNRKAH